MICLFAGYGFVITMMQMRGYHRILLMNVMSCSLVAIYLYFSGAYSGAAVCMIGGLASLIQFFMPLKQDRKAVWQRNLTAAFMAFIATCFLFSKPSDILPCLANFTNRIAEAQGSDQMIRYGMGVSCTLWCTYAFYNALYLFAILEICLLASAIIGAQRNRKDYNKALTKAPAI